MSLPIIFFFSSLILIIIMIGRKLALLRRLQSAGMDLLDENVSFEIPYVKDIRYLTVRNIKKFGHASLVTTMRFYYRSNNLLKNKFEETKNKIKHRATRNRPEASEIERPASNFLKKISEYKRRIRRIKQKIKEEEKNL